MLSGVVAVVVPVVLALGVVLLTRCVVVRCCVLFCVCARLLCAASGVHALLLCVVRCLMRAVLICVAI